MAFILDSRFIVGLLVGMAALWLIQSRGKGRTSA